MGEKRIDQTCIDCKERYEACHDHCEKYQEAVKKWKAYKDMVYRGKNPTEHDMYKFESIRAMKKRRKNRDRGN